MWDFSRLYVCQLKLKLICKILLLEQVVQCEHGILRQIIVGLEEILNDFNDLLKNKSHTIKCAVDTTYKLGDLFVTVFSYQNFLFESNPAIPVAFMLHEKKRCQIS